MIYTLPSTRYINESVNLQSKCNMLEKDHLRSVKLNEELQIEVQNLINSNSSSEYGWY